MRCYNQKDFIENYSTIAPIGNNLVSRDIYTNLEDAERAFAAEKMLPAEAYVGKDPDPLKPKKMVDYEVVSLLAYSYTLTPELYGKTNKELIESNTENDQIILDEKFSRDERIPAHLVHYRYEEQNGAKMMIYTYDYSNGDRKLLGTVLVDEKPQDHLDCIEIYEKSLKKVLTKGD